MSFNQHCAESNSKLEPITELVSELGYTIPLPTKELQQFAANSERNQKLLIIACELVHKCAEYQEDKPEEYKSQLDYLINICRLIEASQPGIKRLLLDFLIKQPDTSLYQEELQTNLLHAWIEQAENEVNILKNTDTRQRDIDLVSKVRNKISDLLDRVSGLSLLSGSR